MLSDTKDQLPEATPPSSSAENDGGIAAPIEDAACAAQGIPMDCAAQEQPAPGKPFQLADYFVCQEWHRPYAAALLETEPLQLALRIAEAERAMASRYLELYLTTPPTEELSDLQNAAYALSQMKRALEIAATQQRYLA